MSEPIPVNPVMLRWARETLGVPVEDVAQRMKKDTAEIEAWERGESAPTYVQLETLAYKVYRRPLALFFFPQPPEEDRIENSFRTLPQDMVSEIPARIRYLLRNARVLQMNLAELYDDVTPASKHILADLSFSARQPVTEIASQVRDYFGITLEEQSKWKSVDDAFRAWREILEDHGVFVFRDSFNPKGKRRPCEDYSDYSGFCLYDPVFPVIYANSNQAKSRQIFTLFHELAHLLMHTGGVDMRQDDFLDKLSGTERRIEVLCNRFAAEFLVPRSDFRAHAEALEVDEQNVSRLARRYSVSKEVILRRFLDWHKIDSDYYEEKVANWPREIDSKPKKKTTGPTHYITKGSYLGERYIERVFSKYYQDQLTAEQVAEYLDENPKNVAGFEEWLLERGVSQ